MASLAEILLQGKEDLSDDVCHSIINLSDLERALEAVKQQSEDISERIQTLQRNHGNQLEELEGSLVTLEKELWPLEREFAQLKLQGDPLAIAQLGLQRTLTMLEERCKSWEQQAENLPLAYQRYLEEQVLKRAQELATKPSYEKCLQKTLAKLSTQQSQEFTVSVATTTKTATFGELLEVYWQRLSELESELSWEFSGQVAIIYFGTFLDAFSRQISQLPHLAALFYNDCNYITLLLSQRQDGKVNNQHIRTIEGMGTRILQQAINQQKDDLGEFCNQDGRLTGIIDEAFLANLHTILEQATLRISQLGNVLRGILDEDLCQDLLHDLCYHFLTGLWRCLLQASGLDRAVGGDLSEALEGAAHLVVDVLGVEGTLRRPSTLEGKLSTLGRIVGMTLIQLSNAFRRDEFSGILELVELMDIVNLLYPNSAMKRAFLAEIEAEI